VVTGAAGQTLFTRSDVIAGQETFLRNGLMEYGSIFGHGAYLGPDFTADYLHRAALSVLGQYGGELSDRAHAQTIADFKTNRYNAPADTLSTRQRKPRHSRNSKSITVAFSLTRVLITGCAQPRFPTRKQFIGSRRSSVGRPGPRRLAGLGCRIRTPTIGHRKH
jgi:hypothetical protein